jgi:hypothetical protein
MGGAQQILPKILVLIKRHHFFTSSQHLGWINIDLKDL